MADLLEIKCAPRSPALEDRLKNGNTNIIADEEDSEIDVDVLLEQSRSKENTIRRDETLDPMTVHDANRFFNMEDNDELRQHSKIKKYFSEETIKLLYYVCLSYEIVDNNIKSEIISEILGPEFQELGTGTNRISFLYGNYVYKVALDRRGITDNVMEFKRSKEAPQFLTKTYETNGIIAVAEYVHCIEQEKFAENRNTLLQLLGELAKYYIFSDIGYDPKNYCNLGYRENGALVVLDYAYMHPREGNDEALRCNCGAPLEYTPDFTKFKCTNSSCGIIWPYADIRRRMNDDYENLETRYMTEIADLELPDFENLQMDIVDDEDEDHEQEEFVSENIEKLLERLNKNRIPDIDGK